MRNISKYLMLLLLAGACATTNSGTGSTTTVATNEVRPDGSSQSLSTYLKQVAGVLVQTKGGETFVYIRGQNTMSEQREPLFVVDGVRIGFGYETAFYAVDVQDIDTIRVLKSGGEAAKYGLQGNNGVIEITTKLGRETS